MYDLLIRNGRVVDGSGNPWFCADVGVKDGSIAAIGRIGDKAERVIDADGLYVSPGFIDVHCHSDFTVLDPANPRDFKLRQGITMECAGQCGESAAPVNPETLDLLKAYVAFEALEESFEVGRKAGLPVVISHIGVQGQAKVGKIGEVLGTIEKAREEGLEVTIDVFPLAAGTTLRLLLPHWVSEGTLEELFRRLRDPDGRRRMKQAMVEETARLAADTAVCRWDEIRLARVLSEQNRRFQGMTISEISRLEGKDPETTVMDLILEERCQATMYRIFKQTDDLAAAVVHPLTMIETDAMGFVEGNPSIGQYGSFPRVLGYYVREKNLLRLEEAVRKMTSYAAQTMGLRRKGLLREGADADITLFDLDSVKASLDGNQCYSKGIEYVVVNGRVVVDGGAYHGAMAGRVVRRSDAGARLVPTAA